MILAASAHDTPSAGTCNQRSDRSPSCGAIRCGTLYVGITAIVDASAVKGSEVTQFQPKQNPVNYETLKCSHSDSVSPSCGAMRCGTLYVGITAGALYPGSLLLPPLGLLLPLLPAGAAAGAAAAVPAAVFWRLGAGGWVPVRAQTSGSAWICSMYCCRRQTVCSIHIQIDGPPRQVCGA